MSDRPDFALVAEVERLRRAGDDMARVLEVFAWEFGGAAEGTVARQVSDGWAAARGR